jgi:LPS export ABC transporter protein LptC
MFIRRSIRPLFMVLFGLLIVTQILVLSPSSLEETKTSTKSVDPDTLISDTGPTLAPGIPKDRIAEYAIEKFKYVSIQNGEKQWRIEANKAFLYNPERLVHSRHVHAYLYDPEGKITVVTGLEARYFMNQKDLEVYGNVKTTFPDGFELNSNYLRYKPNEKRIVIPHHYPVHGFGRQTSDQIFAFNSLGLDYPMGDLKVILPKAAQVILEKPPSKTNLPASSNSRNSDPNSGAGVPDRTIIDSDHCLIDRKHNMAYFTMNPSTPLQDRFVHITQPTLFARSRTADLNYGSFNQILQYLIAYEDVLVKEIAVPKSPKKAAAPINVTKDKKTNEKVPLRYATAGKAEFNTRDDVIRLTQFPQAYQDEDTVTGDVILMHRDSDVIEIEHSNSFSEGRTE